MAGPAAAETFVAIAYDQFAVAYGFASAQTPSAARADAVRMCADQAAPNCKVVLLRSEVCVSLAVDFSNGGYGSASGATSQEAAASAVELCASYEDNERCQAVDTLCAFDETETN